MPVIPSREEAGKGFTVVPEQTGWIRLKVGVTCDVMVIVNVAELAHCPLFGVKVYVVVVVLFNAGDHDPLIPLLDWAGSGATVAPTQYGPCGEKDGKAG